MGSPRIGRRPLLALAALTVAALVASAAWRDDIVAWMAAPSQSPSDPMTPPPTTTPAPDWFSSGRAPYDATQFPPPVEPPASECESSYQANTSRFAPETPAWDRLQELASVDHAPAAACAHLHAWNDYVLQVGYEPYRLEAALLAGIDASDHDDPGYARRFFVQAAAAPASRRVDPVAGTAFGLRTFYDHDTKRADENRSLPVYVAAALHQAGAAFDEAVRSANATYYLHGLRALDAALQRTSSPVHQWILHLERGNFLYRLPPTYRVNVYEEWAHTFRNPLGPHLHPLWETFMGFSGSFPEAHDLLEDDYVRFYGQNQTYHVIDGARRWYTDPVPYCFANGTAASLVEHAVWAARAWAEATDGQVRLRHEAECPLHGAIRVQPVANLRSGSAPVFDEARFVRRCDVSIQTGNPLANLNRSFAHEFGHCLGLGHSPFSGDLMGYHGVDLSGERVTPRDVATLLLQSRRPALGFEVARTVRSDRDGGDEASRFQVAVTFRADVRRVGDVVVQDIYLDEDGDLEWDRRESPDADGRVEFTVAYRETGAYRASLDITPTFTSPSARVLPLLVGACASDPLGRC